MNKALDFQSVIMALQKFWAEQGCLIWQPYYSQVGAGTMNPGTFLRVLGPEPWKVAYVEPSVRPDDGRYGENPNRFQQHYQFQVILKPDPGNPQEIYLRSLEAIGIDPREHGLERLQVAVDVGHYSVPHGTSQDHRPVRFGILARGGKGPRLLVSGRLFGGGG